MDDNQKKLVQLMAQHHECTKDRKCLKAFLADTLPDSRIHQNLILSAYDEDIVGLLTKSQNTALTALRTVRVLVDSYGITNDSAIWSIVTWCYMLGLNEIADSIGYTYSEHGKHPEQNTATTSNGNSQYLTTIGLGSYAAGYDIPEGYISIRANSRISKGQIRMWVKAGKKEQIVAEFKDAASVSLEKGQIVRLELIFSDDLNWPDYKFSIVSHH